MRKLLLTLVASLAVSVVLVVPANAAVIASVDITGGSFQYDENGGLTSSTLDPSADYLLLASGTFENLVFPTSGLNTTRHYYIDIFFNGTLASSGHTHIVDETFDATASLNGIIGFFSLFTDLAYTLNLNGTSGTFDVGFTGNPFGLISGADSGTINSGHIALRAAVPEPATIGLLLFALGILGAGLVIRRRNPLA